MSGLTRHNLFLKEQRARKFPFNTFKTAVEESRVLLHIFMKKNPKPKKPLNSSREKKKKIQAQIKSNFPKLIRIKANNLLTSGFAFVTGFPPLMGTWWQQR